MSSTKCHQPEYIGLRAGLTAGVECCLHLQGKQVVLVGGSRRRSIDEVAKGVCRHRRIEGCIQCPLLHAENGHTLIGCFSIPTGQHIRTHKWPHTMSRPCNKL